MIVYAVVGKYRGDTGYVVDLWLSEDKAKASLAELDLTDHKYIIIPLEVKGEETPKTEPVPDAPPIYGFF